MKYNTQSKSGCALYWSMASGHFNNTLMNLKTTTGKVFENPAPAIISAGAIISGLKLFNTS